VFCIPSSDAEYGRAVSAQAQAGQARSAVTYSGYLPYGFVKLSKIERFAGGPSERRLRLARYFGSRVGRVPHLSLSPKEDGGTRAQADRPLGLMSNSVPDFTLCVKTKKCATRKKSGRWSGVSEGGGGEGLRGENDGCGIMNDEGFCTIASAYRFACLVFGLTSALETTQIDKSFLAEAFPIIAKYIRELYAQHHRFVMRDELAEAFEPDRDGKAAPSVSADRRNFGRRCTSTYSARISGVTIQLHSSRIAT
jgi:hypothetical protein